MPDNRMMTRILLEREQASSSVMVLANDQDLKNVVGFLLPIATVQAIHLRFPDLSVEEQSFWQSRIDKNLRACGCGQGLIGTVLLLGIFGAYRWLDPLQQSWNGWSTFFVAFGFAVAGAGLGKISGLVRARLQLRRTLLELEKALSMGGLASARLAKSCISG